MISLLQNSCRQQHIIKIMNCSICTSSNGLPYVCQQCYRAQQQKSTRMLQQLKVGQKKEMLQSKLKSIDIQKLIRIKQQGRKQIKIRKIKQRINQLKSQIVQEQTKQQKLEQIYKFYQQNFKLKTGSQKNNSDQQTKQYLTHLSTKNRMLKQKNFQQKKKKKHILQTIMKVFSSEQKKYKIMKYFRLQQNKNIIFTLQSTTHGIPVIKANNEQIIGYYCIEQKQKKAMLRQEQQILVLTLKISHKFVVLLQKVLLNSIKLPYKMYFYKQYCYLANNFIKFDNQLIDLRSTQLLNFVNMLQANLQYIAYLVSATDKPFILFDKMFLDHIEKQGFVNNINNVRAWKSYLKYLKPVQIQNHYEEEEHASQVIVIGMEKDSDQEFQILE